MNDEYLSPAEFSKLLKVSRPYPYVLASRGLIAYCKIGKLIRFKMTDVQEFLQRSRVEKKKN
jgi:excisionase family DNA binding protein